MRVRLFGDGNLDESLCASQDGFFVPAVSVLNSVQAGDPVGRILDVHGRVIESFSAPTAGVIAMIRASPVVQPGDPLFLITGVKEYV